MLLEYLGDLVDSILPQKFEKHLRNGQRQERQEVLMQKVFFIFSFEHMNKNIPGGPTYPRSPLTPSSPRSPLSPFVPLNTRGWG